MPARTTLESPRRVNLLVLRVRSSRVTSDDVLLRAPLAVDGDEQLERAIVVTGAGDARANGSYQRCGKQNNAARWRHVDRNWLCILRDGSNWWIGAERAAVEDLYWCDATVDSVEWKVCPCDDTAHRHFKGSAPAPRLAWAEETNTLMSECVFDSDECPICLSGMDDATRMPCGHVACACCLARSKHAARARDSQLRCPLCRAPFTLAGALHVPTSKPLLEAMPRLEADTVFCRSNSTNDTAPRTRLVHFWHNLAGRRALRVRNLQDSSSPFDAFLARRSF